MCVYFSKYTVSVVVTELIDMFYILTNDLLVKSGTATVMTL